jgi:hypothetical protein
MFSVRFLIRADNDSPHLTFHQKKTLPFLRRYTSINYLKEANNSDFFFAIKHRLVINPDYLAKNHSLFIYIKIGELSL